MFIIEFLSFENYFFFDYESYIFIKVQPFLKSNAKFIVLQSFFSIHTNMLL